MDGESLDSISTLILATIKFTLDDNGAWEWNLRLVGTFSALFFFVFLQLFKNAFEVPWWGLSHASITGFGAMTVCYLDYFVSKEMTGIQGRTNF